MLGSSKELRWGRPGVLGVFWVAVDARSYSTTQGGGPTTLRNCLSMTVHFGSGDAGGKGLLHLPGSTELRSGGPGVVGGAVDGPCCVFRPRP